MLVLLATIFGVSDVSAQFKSATIGVDGLNCPSCSYGVEQSLRKLDFVQDIKTDLNTATATITFSPDKKVSIDDLSKKVYQAGFSVRFMNAVYHFPQPRKVAGDTVIINQRVFYFLQSSSALLEGDVTLQLIGEKFVSKKTMKQWEPEMQQARIKYPMLRPDTYFVLL
jgi:copper chaperone CopZ